MEQEYLEKKGARQLDSKSETAGRRKAELPWACYIMRGMLAYGKGKGRCRRGDYGQKVGVQVTEKGTRSVYERISLSRCGPCYENTWAPLVCLVSFPDSYCILSAIAAGFGASEENKTFTVPTTKSVRRKINTKLCRIGPAGHSCLVDSPSWDTQTNRYNWDWSNPEEQQIHGL